MICTQLDPASLTCVKLSNEPGPLRLMICRETGFSEYFRVLSTNSSKLEYNTTFTLSRNRPEKPVGVPSEETAVGVVVVGRIGHRPVPKLVAQNPDAFVEETLTLASLRALGPHDLVAPGRYLTWFSLKVDRSTPSDVRKDLPIFCGWQII